MSRDRRILGLAVIGLALCLVATVFGWAEPRALLRGWLLSAVIWVGLPLGGLALALTQSLTGGRWGRAIAPQIDAAIATLPLAVILFLPVLCDLGAVYPWAGPTGAALPNHFWLNTPFFIERSVLYFILWLGLAVLVLIRRAEGDPVLPGGLAGPGLVILFASMTLMAVDWTMSLEPRWSSSVYGLLSVTDEFIFGLGVIIVARLALGAAPEALADLAKLLLGAVIFWAYLDFMQWLIIWELDLSQDIPWYVVRLRGGWRVVSVIVPLGYFVVPFFALIFRGVQRDPRKLLTVTILLLLMHVLFDALLVLPAGTGGGIGWTGPLAFIGTSCLWIGAFIWTLDHGPLIAASLRRRRVIARPHGH